MAKTLNLPQFVNNFSPKQYYLLPSGRIKHKKLMKTKRNCLTKKLTSKQIVKQFFLSIRRRQLLEDLFYATGDSTLLPEIELARKVIKNAINEICMND